MVISNLWAEKELYSSQSAIPFDNNGLSILFGNNQLLMLKEATGTDGLNKFTDIHFFPEDLDDFLVRSLL